MAPGNVLLETIQQLTKVGSVRARRGQKIHEQGDPVDSMFFLSAGVVRLSSVLHDDSDEATTLLLRAPAIWGDREIIAESSSYSERATALVPSAVTLIPIETAHLLLKRQEFAHALTNDLAQRYAASIAFLSLRTAPLEVRICAMGLLGAFSVETLVEEMSLALCVHEDSVRRALKALRKENLFDASTGVFDAAKIRSKFHGLAETVEKFSHTIRCEPHFTLPKVVVPM